MTQSETAISQLCAVHERQMTAFVTVMQNVARLTDNIVSMNLATLRQDVAAAVRDTLGQEATQVCNSRPGPPTRAQPRSMMPEPRRASQSHGEPHQQWQAQLYLLEPAGSKFQRWGMAKI